MSQILKLISVFILILNASSYTIEQSSTANSDTIIQKEYQLVWSDEFNTNGIPDTAKWRFENGFVRNLENQWYQKENAICKKGLLQITGERENMPNPNFVKGSNNWKTNRKDIKFTSASLVMKKEHAFLYGKLEVRAKIDAQTGLWPAIWTLGINGKWPANGEVDLMEYYDNKILANFAIASKNGQGAIWDSHKRSLDSLGGEKWAKAFHVWTLIWDENKMEIYVDDILLNDIDLNKTFNKSDGKNPFRQPHYVLLNLALGGDKGGSLQNTKLPSKYLVDYVRIYQLQ